MFPGYTNRKALDRKSFPCNDAQVSVTATGYATIAAVHSSCFKQATTA
jgi:hypothetical protein